MHIATLPIKPALALTLLLSKASCSVSRHVVSEERVAERAQEAHEVVTLTAIKDSLSEDLNIQLDTVEIVIHDTVVVVKAQKMALSKHTESSQSLQQLQLVRDTVYIEKVVEMAQTEDVEQVSAAEPPDFTLIIIVCFCVLLIAVFLYKKLSG